MVYIGIYKHRHLLQLLKGFSAVSRVAFTTHESSKASSNLYESRSLAEQYQKYRPIYPTIISEAIIDYMRSKHPEKPLNERYDRMLDVGCGGGQSTWMFGPHFNSILGIDISAEQIKVAEEQNYVKNIRFKKVEDNKFPVEDGSMDLVTMAAAAHLLDIKIFENECQRVLKPGGCAAIYTYNPILCRSTTKRDADGMYRCGDVLSLLKQFHEDCESHPGYMIFIEQYKPVFNEISNRNKRWIENLTMEREYTMKMFENLFSTMGEYVSFMEERKPEFDPLRKFVHGMKKLLGQEGEENDAVEFIITFGYPMIVYSKD